MAAWMLRGPHRVAQQLGVLAAGHTEDERIDGQKARGVITLAAKSG
jgi:hypothetical protein